MSNLITAALSRRQCLQVGAIGVSAVSLANWAAGQTPGGSSTAAGKSVIMIYLPGGPSHIDMFDMKPRAPAEIRGEFQPISTNVRGLDICELLPQLSRIADKYSLVRGFLMPGGHDAKEVTTGFKPQSNRPAFGSVISRLQERAPQPLPPYITLIEETNLPFGQDPAYLGASHKPFTFRGPDMENLSLPKGMPRDRLVDRVALLSHFDLLNRAQDRRGEMTGMDAFTLRALEMVTSPKVRDAFDVSREPQALRERYGLDPASTQFLRARRLVEAGAKVVTLCGGWVSEGQSPANLSNWDTHDENFPRLREQLPRLDHALSALVTDLHERGLDKDVVVVACGEMGRAPRVGVPNEGSNATASGRDHWPTGFCFLSGGGLKMGQVVGETDRRGEASVGRPVTVQNLLATLYHILGVDPGIAFLDQLSRPQTLLDEQGTITGLW